MTDLGQKVESSERLLVRNDGELLPITKTVVELSIGDKKFLLESFIDISNVKAAEKALKLSNERYQDLSARVRDIMFRFTFQPTMGFDQYQPVREGRPRIP